MNPIETAPSQDSSAAKPEQPQAEQPQMRALTAYQSFFKETFATLKAQATEQLGDRKWASSDTQAVVKKVGEQWRALSDEQKKSFDGKASTVIKAKAPKKRKAQSDGAKNDAAAGGAVEANNGEPIVRPLSAYQCFFKETFATLKAAHVETLGGRKWSSVDTQKVVKEVGVRWRALTDEQKKTFEGKLTTTILPKKSSKKRKSGTAGGNSTRKMTAYNVFVRESSQGKGAGAAERMKLIGEQWNAMGDEARAGYQLKADKLNEAAEANPPAPAPAPATAPATAPVPAPTGMNPVHQVSATTGITTTV